MQTYLEIKSAEGDKTPVERNYQNIWQPAIETEILMMMILYDCYFKLTYLWIWKHSITSTIQQELNKQQE